MHSFSKKAAHKRRLTCLFCITKAPQQLPGHAAAQLRQVEPALIDAPLEQGSPVQHHQLLHHLIRVMGGVDAALLLAQRHQLQQYPEVYPPGVFLQPAAPDTAVRG